MVGLVASEGVTGNVVCKQRKANETESGWVASTCASLWKQLSVRRTPLLSLLISCQWLVILSSLFIDSHIPSAIQARNIFISKDKECP